MIGLVTYGAFDPDPIFNLVGQETSTKINIGEIEYKVNLDSLRLKLFKRNRKCVCCGIEGVVMFLQKHHSSRNDDRPHFNFYALGDYCKPILITKDHITPRSKGGKDKLSNLQTMCHICNDIKGNDQNLSFGEIIKIKNNKIFPSPGPGERGSGKRSQNKNKDYITRMALQDLLVKTYNISDKLNDHILKTLINLDDKKLMSEPNKQRWANQLESILKHKNLV